MTLILNELSIHDKVMIFGHRFRGLDEIKASVELSCTESDILYNFRFSRNIDHKKITGIHVAEIYAPYPCFDSYDSIYENRKYRNYFFSREPFTETRLREIYNSCTHKMDFRLVSEDMPASCTPAIYYKGEGDKMIVAVDSNEITPRQKNIGALIIKWINKITSCFQK
ncbi:MAG: hypothetical protein K2H98_05940 [Duncaniella sp.]|nr:hypothetical protein [Duncaniella sp.]